MKIDEGTKRRWDVMLGITGPVLTLVTVLLGVWQFDRGAANRREDDFHNAMLKDEIEFRRKLWLEQLETYRSISKLSGRIVATPPGKERDAAISEFETAYWGSMILVSDKEVTQAMIGLRQALRDEKNKLGDPNDVKVWADKLGTVCRNSLAAGSPEKLRRPPP